MPSNKRSGIKHKGVRANAYGGHYTECGLWLSDTSESDTRTKWASVTCKNCLKRKGKR